MAAKIVHLIDAARQRGEYGVRLEQVADDLEFAVDEMTDSLINLAMAGPWREWDEKQPVGAVANIDLPALADTKDPTVSAVARLLMDMTLVLRNLRKKAPSDFQ